MKLKSETFTEIAGYRKARKQLIKDVKNEFGVTGRLSLPWDAIRLYSTNFPKVIASKTYDIEDYVANRMFLNGGEYYLETLDLVTK